MTTLLLSSRPTEDNQALWRAAIRRGWNIERARGIRLPEISEREEIVIYVEALYASTVAEALGRSVLEPPEDWLVQLSKNFTRRQIQIMSLSQARNLNNSMFVKPPNDKLFKAQVYDSGLQLPTEFDEEMNVLVAEPIEWLVEFRCFSLNGKVMTMSPYFRNGQLAKLDGYSASQEELEQAENFANKVLSESSNPLPKAIVLDVGLTKYHGWAVVEANGAWGSGIYNCDPDLVLEVIRHATVPTN